MEVAVSLADVVTTTTTTMMVDGDDDNNYVCTVPIDVFVQPLQKVSQKLL